MLVAASVSVSLVETVAVESEVVIWTLCLQRRLSGLEIRMAAHMNSLNENIRYCFLACFRLQGLQQTWTCI